MIKSDPKLLKNHLSFFFVFFLLLALFPSCSSPPAGIIIFCAGDSITEAAYPHYLRMIFNKEGLRAKVLNYGRKGYNSGEYLNFLEKNEESLKAEHPDYILLQLGTNDARLDGDFTPPLLFKANMKRIIEIFQTFKNRRGKETIMLLANVPPIPEESPYPFSSDSSIRVRDEINPVIKDICEEERILMVDNYSLFLNSPSLLPDVHPNQEGYKALAKNWYQSLKVFLDKK